MTAWSQTSPRESREHDAARPEQKAPGIAFKDVWWQFRADIFSKEVQTSPTYSYQWMACQTGHIGLGMVAFFAIAGAGAAVSPIELPSWAYLAAVAALAALKEGCDLYTTNRKIQTTFNARLDKRNVALDALLAVVYMVLGAAFAYGIVEHWPAWTVIPWLVPVVAIVRWCLPQKMYFQQAGLPFLFRLPEFTAPVAETGVGLINGFTAAVGSETQQHLAIFGRLETGKTSLAVGIGTEAAFAGKVVRYLTFTKLCEIGLGEEPPAPRNTRLWKWRDSELLILDDVVGGLRLFGKGRGVSPADSLKSVLGELAGSLAGRQVIWVIDGNDSADAAQWISAIRTLLGSHRAKLAWVVLEKTRHNNKAMSIASAAAAS
jgi:hypothetical protein